MRRLETGNLKDKAATGNCGQKEEKQQRGGWRYMLLRKRGLLMSKRVLTIVAVFVALLFAIFVWPTRYRYDHVTDEGNSLPVRFDRSSGHGEIFVVGSGWMKTGEKGEADESDRRLPSSELSKLDGGVALYADGYICCNLHNLSTWSVEAVDVELTMKNKDRTDRLSFTVTLYLDETHALFADTEAITGQSQISEVLPQADQSIVTIVQNYNTDSEFRDIIKKSQKDSTHTLPDRLSEPHKTYPSLGSFLPPQGRGKFTAELSSYLKHGDLWSWRLFSAQGKRG